MKMTIADRAAFQAVRTGLAIARALASLYPEDWHVADVGQARCRTRRSSTRSARAAPLDDLVLQANADVAAWRTKRDKYLLYPSVAVRSPDPSDGIAATIGG